MSTVLDTIPSLFPDILITGPRQVGERSERSLGNGTVSTFGDSSLRSESWFLLDLLRGYLFYFQLIKYFGAVACLIPIF